MSKSIITGDVANKLNGDRMRNAYQRLHGDRLSALLFVIKALKALYDEARVPD